MAWIDNKKANDIVPQSWIIDCLKMYKLSGEIIVYREYHGKLESGTDSRRQKISRGENLNRDLPWKCTITICNSDDTSESHI